jgi:hypothetical protein
VPETSQNEKDEQPGLSLGAGIALGAGVGAALERRAKKPEDED